MKFPKYPRIKFRIALAIGAMVATVLCVQSIRTYLYTDSVLVPQQAEREAERQVGVLTGAARSAGITNARSLGPAIQHALESARDRVLWIRVLDDDNRVQAQGGNPHGTAKIPSRWWERVEKHESLGSVVNTAQGKAFVGMLPFRLPRPPHPPENGFPRHPPESHRPPGFVVEIAIPLNAVAGSFDGLRQNLIVGVVASIALLLSLLVIALRAPHYLRGKYLESEMQLARSVQSDLLPNQRPISQHIEFAAQAVAADHVGGDFYDVFEMESGKIAMLLGDVSGKGVPAALLASVLQGAIRSSMAAQHERACERINRMLCERTACERFATLFWGVFDPATSTLRYVNAGHTAPMLVRYNPRRVDRLHDGGPVLGMLPNATYTSGTVRISASDKLILYSDGINEAANPKQEEFGDARIAQLALEKADASPSDLCERIMTHISEFAGTTIPQDDRTLLVLRFPKAQVTNEITMEAVA